MSWAAHNPEAYEAIVKDGIVNRLRQELVENGFDPDGNAIFTLAALVESLAEAKDTRVYNALVDWSTREISEAEADHWATLADSRE